MKNLCARARQSNRLVKSLSPWKKLPALTRKRLALLGDMVYTIYIIYITGSKIKDLQRNPPWLFVIYHWERRKDSAIFIHFRSNFYKLYTY